MTMTKQELLRNQADALDWIKQGKKVQWRTGALYWQEYDPDKAPAPGDNISVQWRIKPEVRELPAPYRGEA